MSELKSQKLKAAEEELEAVLWNFDDPVKRNLVDAIAKLREAAEDQARDDTFHDVILATCQAASALCDADVEREPGGHRSILRMSGAVHVQRALAEMRGLVCQVCSKSPMAENHGGGAFSFTCECGFTESPSPPKKRRGSPS